MFYEGILLICVFIRLIVNGINETFLVFKSDRTYFSKTENYELLEIGFGKE